MLRAQYVQAAYLDIECHFIDFAITNIASILSNKSTSECILQLIFCTKQLFN